MTATAFDEKCEWTGVVAADRNDWLIARRAGVGGSDVATIMGMGPTREDGTPYKAALEVYAEKVATGIPDDRSSEQADWGRIFEAPILAEYSRRTKRLVAGGGALLRSRENPIWLVTLDGEQYDDGKFDGPGIADCKTTSAGKRYKDDVPLDVQVQLQFYMMVTGAEWSTVVWLPFPERILQWRDIRPHDEFRDMMVEEIASFWQRVCDRDPPLPDGSESSTRALRRLFPDDSRETIALPGERAMLLADEYQNLAAEKKRVESRQAEIKNMLAATMMNDRVALLDDGRYWMNKPVAPKKFYCEHCQGVIGTREGYRTPRLWQPRKTPHEAPVASRQIVDPMVKALEDSLDG